MKIMTENSQNTFYIVGSQRSGTTLLRLMLGSHPDIYCFDELYAYDILRQGGKTEKTQEFLSVGFKIPRWTEYLDRTVIPPMKDCEGTTKFYADDPILFLVRNPLDVVTSMLGLNLGGHCWLEVYGVADVQKSFSENPTYQERYKKEIEYISSNPTIGSYGALLWRIKTDAYHAYLEQGFPVLRVEYEDLVQESRSVMEKVLKHIGYDWHESVLAHHNAEDPEAFDNGMSVGQTDPHKEVFSSSVGQWKTTLSEKAIEDIKAIAGSTYEALTGTPIK
jgi:hypothetical protein